MSYLIHVSYLCFMLRHSAELNFTVCPLPRRKVPARAILRGTPVREIQARAFTLWITTASLRISTHALWRNSCLPGNRCWLS